MKRWLIIVALVCVAVGAQPTQWFQASLVDVDLNVSSSIDLIPKGQNPYVQYLEAKVSFWPRQSEFLTVQDIAAYPNARLMSDRAVFEWGSPNPGTLLYGYDAKVGIVNNVPRVKAKIPYPIDPPRGFDEYLKPTRHIDAADPAIVMQAKALAQGEDDLFILATKIGRWVKTNIEYNLSTLTADVSQSASWVLENRNGVCDELTSVYIAMLRSLGIPARFVSGLAFTDNPAFPQGWGAHGWAEVYFPGVGWVPFDPTFGEYGWVDPGHMKLKESLDPQEPTTVFEWKSRDVSVEVADLELSAAKVGEQGNVPFELSMQVSPVKSRVGFGSYNAVMVEVENRADYYVAMDLFLTRVTDMEVVGGQTRLAVVPPRGRDRLFWLVKAKEALDPAFQYEIPLVVYTVRNDTANASFVVGAQDPAFSKETIESTIEQLQIAKESPFELACAFENDFVKQDVAKLNCMIESNEERDRSVQVCFETCEPMLLKAKESLPISFAVPAPAFGPNEAKVTVSDGPLQKKAVLTVVRLDAPQVAIERIDVPEQVAYDDAFTLSFTLSRKSVSFPQNVSVVVSGGGARAKIPVGELTGDQEVTVNVRADQLYSGSPDFDIVASYRDIDGKSFSTSRSFELRVSGMPWWKRVVGFFVDVF